MCLGGVLVKPVSTTTVTVVPFTVFTCFPMVTSHGVPRCLFKHSQSAQSSIIIMIVTWLHPTSGQSWRSAHLLRFIQ